MCVKTQECTIVHECTVCSNGSSVIQSRTNYLEPTGTTEVGNGQGRILYFYRDNLKG